MCGVPLLGLPRADLGGKKGPSGTGVEALGRGITEESRGCRGAQGTPHR